MPSWRYPFGIAFSPDSQRLAIGYADTTAVDVLDAGTPERLFAADTKGVEGGNLYAAGRWGGGGEFRLRRWSAAGRGAQVDLPLSGSTVTALRGLPGEQLAFAAADPGLGLLGVDGKPAWSMGAATADFRGQEKALAVSADGTRLGFGYEPFGKSPVLFSLPERRLVPGGTGAGLAAAVTAAPGLGVEGWNNGTEPSLNGGRLALRPYERAHSIRRGPGRAALRARLRVGAAPV